jgi:hypothetical protein
VAFGQLGSARYEVGSSPQRQTLKQASADLASWKQLQGSSYIPVRRQRSIANRADLCVAAKFKNLEYADVVPDTRKNGIDVSRSSDHCDQLTSRLIGSKLPFEAGQGVAPRFNFKEVYPFPDNGQIRTTGLFSDREFSSDSGGPIDGPRLAEVLNERRFCRWFPPAIARLYR